MDGATYYIGGNRALYHHHLTTQIYVTKIDVFSNKFLANREIKGVQLYFHRIRPKKLGLGKELVVFPASKLWFADKERTVLDLLVYPKLFGQYDGGAKMFSYAIEKVDVNLVCKYTLEFEPVSVCQRLGALLDWLDIKPTLYKELLDKVQKSEVVSFFISDSEETGKFNKKWGIIINVELKEKLEMQWR